MKKLRKYQRVERYLENLQKSEQFSTNTILKLQYRDLIGKPGLEKIGDRTIANCLNSFKSKFLDEPVCDKLTKRKHVEGYLNNLWSSGKLKTDDVMNLSCLQLQKIQELKGISKTTLACVLSSFKKTFEGEIFEKNILNFFDKARDDFSTSTKTDVLPSKQNLPKPMRLNGFDKHEIKIVREMIIQYRLSQQNTRERTNKELRELKLALRFVGIDCGKILQLYWKINDVKLLSSAEKNLSLTPKTGNLGFKYA